MTKYRVRKFKLQEMLFFTKALLNIKSRILFASSSRFNLEVSLLHPSKSERYYSLESIQSNSVFLNFISAYNSGTLRFPKSSSILFLERYLNMCFMILSYRLFFLYATITIPSENCGKNMHREFSIRLLMTLFKENSVMGSHL